MLILNQCYSGFLLKILFNSIDPKATSAGAERALRNIWPGFRGSLRLDVSSVDHLRPLGGIRLDYHSKLLRRIEGRLKTELRQALAHVGLRRDLRDVCVHLADDGSRCAGWRRQPEPRDGSSEMIGERLSDVTASPRNLPSRTTGRIPPMFCMVIVTRPPITSVKTAPR